MCYCCGEVEIHGRGARYCDECRWLRAEAHMARKAARAALKARKACRGCGRPKGSGKRRVYCDACRRRRAQPPPKMCERGCGRPARSRQAKLCVECKALARKRQNERRLKWWRENGGPATGGHHPESRRIERRLKAERKGQVLKMAEPQRARGGNWSRREAALFPDLPPQPLAKAIIRLAEREARALSMMSVGGETSARGAVALRLGLTKAPDLCEHCAPAGHPLESCPGWLTSRGTLMVCSRAFNAARAAAGRRLYAWEHGEVGALRFDTVDRILTATGWLWFDVYPECPVGLEHRQAVTAEGECPTCRAHALAERAFTSTAVEPQLQLEAAA